MAETQRAVPTAYVGFDTLTKQVEQKLLKRGFHFNLMVVGQSGLGKSTFINTLFTTHLIDSSGKSKPLEPDSGKNNLTEIRLKNFELEENGVKVKLNIIDTPGYGDFVNNEYCWDTITRYIKDQYAVYLRKELSPTRDFRIPDTRVHAVIYFIAPTGHSLKPLDILVIKKISEICNVIPVIAKADSLTLEERADFKKRIKEELQFHKINVFPGNQVEDQSSDYDAEDVAFNESIRKLIPFAVCGSEEIITIEGGKQVRGRKTKFGTINVEDPVHCEFVHLRNFLIRTHLQQLIETTAHLHYENFRTKQLLALKEASKQQST